MKDTLILALVLSFIVIISLPVWGDSTNDNNAQTNSSGSNTQITGGYTSTTTNNNDGQTNTTTSTTTNNSTTNGSDIPVNSANSPSFSTMSQDVCSMGVSGSLSTLGVGISGGKHYRDLNCERIKLSKVLYDYGMKVAAVSILCQDSRVHSAMQSAGTPCPWNGKIGPDAQAMWDKYPELRPDYEDYVAKLDAIAKIDIEIAKEKDRLEKEKKAEEERIAEEKKIEEERIKEEKRIAEEKRLLQEKKDNKPSIQVHD